MPMVISHTDPVEITLRVVGRRWVFSDEGHRLRELLLLPFRYGITSQPLTERIAIASPTSPLTAKTTP